MAFTIKNIAVQTGVSYSMVSRALNDSGPVASKKKRRILEIAETMGYVPNHAVVFPRKPSPRMIGLYFSVINKSSPPYVLHDIPIGVYSVLGGSCHVIVKGIDMHIPGSLNSNQCDGILVISQWGSDIKFLEGIYRKNIPMVAISHQLPIDIPFIATGETGGMTQAMEHLLKCDHRRVGIIEEPPNLEATVLHYAGWQITAKQQGLSPEEMPVEYDNYCYHSGKTVAGRPLRAYPRLTTLLRLNDEAAFGAKNVAEELGLRVPGNLSLTGFDSLIYSNYSDLRLTIMERSATVTAVEGTKILLQSVSEDDFRPRNTWLETRLIVRDSVKDI